MFKTKDGKLFDPNRKFGTLEDDYLVYEKVTTSNYPQILPAEKYHKKVIENSPSPKKSWFIREHHC